jgi:hypothetical protein
MKKILALSGLLALAACGSDDAVSPNNQPIRLSATMKLAADSLAVSLRVTNLSDTTQVLQWVDCRAIHPTNFAVFRDAALTQRLWERRRQPAPSDCTATQGVERLAPDESVNIRGAPVAVSRILGDSIMGGTYYIAVEPLTLTTRPLLGSYDMPIEAVVPAGRIELRQE